MRLFKKMAYIILIVIALCIVSVFLFMQQKTFGKNPTGTRLQRIETSPNYKDGSFQNLLPTEVTLKNTSFTKMMYNFINKSKTSVPPNTIPSIKTNLKALEAEKPTVIWFGHSSYLIKSKQASILVDPVFSGNASPVSFVGKSFAGSDVYKEEDFPPLDLVIITHDHYDHLDYSTIKKLHSTTKNFIVPLGVGSHLGYWGVEPGKIKELDWWQESKINSEINITSTPARHFSGRGLLRAKTLWTSYVLELHGYKIFLGGDSGYDETFKAIGKEFGHFDLAIIEAGQYGENWPYIHMTPEESVQAAKDLNAKVMLPVHWAKFTLALHDWDEPIKRVSKAATEKAQTITTPLIGQPVTLNETLPEVHWWEKIGQDRK